MNWLDMINNLNINIRQFKHWYYESIQGQRLESYIKKKPEVKKKSLGNMDYIPCTSEGLGLNIRSR